MKVVSILHLMIAIKAVKRPHGFVSDKNRYYKLLLIIAKNSWDCIGVVSDKNRYYIFIAESMMKSS